MSLEFLILFGFQIQEVSDATHYGPASKTGTTRDMTFQASLVKLPTVEGLGGQYMRLENSSLNPS